MSSTQQPPPNQAEARSEAPSRSQDPRRPVCNSRSVASPGSSRPVGTLSESAVAPRSTSLLSSNT
ncbi:gamma histone variant H2AX [Prunus dulcis]|uniref:Gamma histone variant H2AX n=1 Tax=Prunus dulcis TaxID=3755 RepID=A0A4Y1S182_PRUDU|nr:gamma histone variant H2AX [Prunus dulcis]